jgi:hypothetical protein
MIILRRMYVLILGYESHRVGNDESVDNVTCAWSMIPSPLPVSGLHPSRALLEI